MAELAQDVCSLFEHEVWAMLPDPDTQFERLCQGGYPAILKVMTTLNAIFLKYNMQVRQMFMSVFWL